MSHQEEKPFRAGLRPQLLMAVAIALSAIVRWQAFGVDGLWMDEIFSASYCNLEFLDVIVAVLRFDVHPPLYYLQLKLWSWVSVSDAWLMSNSLAWSVGSVALAGCGVSRSRGWRAGVIAALFCGALESEVHFANELRMYSMLSFLALLAWFLIRERRFDAEGFPAWRVLGVLAAMAATHSAAFVAVGACLLYVMPDFDRQDPRRSQKFRSWLRFCFLVAVVLLPWMLLASARQIGHAHVPDIGIAVDTISGWVLGYGAVPLPPLARYGVAIAVAILVGVAVWRGPTAERRLLLSFVVFPVLLVALFSLVIRPIWLDRTLAFCAPFLIIGLIGAVWQGLSRLPRVAGLPMLALLLASLVLLAQAQASTPRKQQYRELAAFLSRHSSVDEHIHVPTRYDFWGVARYLQGPSWGSLLLVQDPVNPDNSSVFPRVYARLGNAWVAALHLLPATRVLTSGSGHLWIGDSPLPAHAIGKGYWLLPGKRGVGSGEPCAMPTRASGRYRFGDLSLVRCEAAGRN